MTLTEPRAAPSSPVVRRLPLRCRSSSRAGSGEPPRPGSSARPCRRGELGQLVLPIGAWPAFAPLQQRTASAGFGGTPSRRPRESSPSASRRRGRRRRPPCDNSRNRVADALRQGVRPERQDRQHSLASGAWRLRSGGLASGRSGRLVRYRTLAAVAGAASRGPGVAVQCHHLVRRSDSRSRGRRGSLEAADRRAHGLRRMRRRPRRSGAGRAATSERWIAPAQRQRAGFQGLRRRSRAGRGRPPRRRARPGVSGHCWPCVALPTSSATSPKTKRTSLASSRSRSIAAVKGLLRPNPSSAVLAGGCRVDDKGVGRRHRGREPCGEAGEGTRLTASRLVGRDWSANGLSRQASTATTPSCCAPGASRIMSSRRNIWRRLASSWISASTGSGSWCRPPGRRDRRRRRTRPGSRAAREKLIVSLSMWSRLRSAP